jgi:hypothetical protein
LDKAGLGSVWEESSGMKAMRLGGGFLLTMFLNVGIAAGELTWSIRISPSTNDLCGVTFNYDQFVAVGKFNTVLTSTNGREWNSRSSGTPDFYSVTAGRGWFVAGGSEGWLIGSSRDGHYWTNTVSTIGQDRLFGFAYGSGRFVGVGSGFHDKGGCCKSDRFRPGEELPTNDQCAACRRIR